MITIKNEFPDIHMALYWYLGETSSTQVWNFELVKVYGPCQFFPSSVTALLNLMGCNARLGEKDAYNNGDGVIPDALIILHNAHPLQRHKSAVGVAVHHLRAHVLQSPISRTQSKIHNLSEDEPAQLAERCTFRVGISVRSYLVLDLEEAPAVGFSIAITRSRI